jgi:hypothetical protein
MYHSIDGAAVRRIPDKFPDRVQIALRRPESGALATFHWSIPIDGLRPVVQPWTHRAIRGSKKVGSQVQTLEHPRHGAIA